ncbi:MAG TPA: hypothetical protein VHS96_03340 [Bacteroidia bacterium]|nr:hypothetical protein [Bacteroidia bacterium]
MKNCTNINRVGNQVIAPPFRIGIQGLPWMLLLLALIGFGPSSLQAQVSQLPTEDLRMEFIKGSAELADPVAAVEVAIDLVRRFNAEDSLVLLVKIRTQLTEITDKSAANDLQVARADVIKALFLPTEALLRDELQVHSSIAYNNEPSSVKFEFHRADGSLLVLRINLEKADSLADQ